MFKRFSIDESVSGQSAMKSSQQRAAKSAIIEQMPCIEPYIEDFFQKKEKTLLIKCAGHVSILASNAGDALFIQTRNGKYMPTLRTLHKYPQLLPIMQVDSGAIKHIINGADVMVPGLRSSNARIQDGVEKGTIVAVFAHGKQHAIGIGLTQMSSQQMRNNDKGIAIESLHYVSDGLWKCDMVA